MHLKLPFKRFFREAALIGFAAILLSSCVSQRDVTYFQPSVNQIDSIQAETINKYINKIQPGDILSVVVSSLSPEASAMFNPFLMAQAAAPTQNTQTNNLQPAIGYMIDEDGCISLPLIEKVKLAGLSTKEATDRLKQKLDKYLQHPTVNLRILNYRVSVMGEVVKPSVYTIPNETITLPEALSLAGDLTIYGKRNNILIIRESNGKREYGHVDLTKRDLFSSPYYYLHPNDVVYVEPTKGKITSTDRTIQIAPILISGLSLVTVIITGLTR